MKVNKEANKCIAENYKYHFYLTLLGPNYFDTLFNSKHKEKIGKLGDILQDNELHFMPIKYIDAYLNGEINEEELIMGKGVFGGASDFALGTPDLAIELALGGDCKKTKSSSAKGQKEEWIYTGEHKEMKRKVVAYKFTFTDNKLTSYEDKSDSCYFHRKNFLDFENDDSTIMDPKYVNARWLFALVSEGLTEKDEEIDKVIIQPVSDFSVEHANEVFEKDWRLNLRYFKNFDAEGKFHDIDFRVRMPLDLGGIKGVSEIVHGTVVLNQMHGPTKEVTEAAQEFINRYKELEEIRNNKIVILNIDELSEWGYKFENSKHEEVYKKVYNLIFDDYRKKLSPETPFHNEYQNFSDAFEIYKQKKPSGCFVATATMGDYNHPTVRSLRRFRDNYLDKKSWGRSFIKHYYKWGPYFANVIAKSNVLKKVSYFTIVKPLAIITTIIEEVDN